jgi:alpha-amylase
LQVTKNIEDHTGYGHAYHGYWQEDIYSVNPHFGTAEDLLALSDALHARGMFLMVDVVVNHMGSPPVVDFFRYIPFNDASYYHPKEFITDYDDPEMCEWGWLGDSTVPLPDLDTENPTVAHTFHAWISALVQRFRIDGLRLDVVKHIPKTFWPGFIRAAGVWCVGEMFSGDPDQLGSFQPYVGGLLDYATYYPLKRAFQNGNGSMYELTSLLTPSYRRKFKDMQQLATFMENHDRPRFPHDTNSDLAVVKNALCWTILSDGIPILYYGQEQSYCGGEDPHCREVMWTSGFKATPLYDHIAVLNRARKISWDAGFGTNLTTALHTNTNIAVTQKGPVLMVLSNEGSQTKPRTISIQSRFPPGTVLVDVLTNRSIVFKNSLRTTVSAGQPQIYIPLPLASQICARIIPPPESYKQALLSFFRFPSNKLIPSSHTHTSWSSGIPTVTGDFLMPTTPIQPGKILQPSPASASSKYSIFKLPLTFPSPTKPTLIETEKSAMGSEIPYNTHTITSEYAQHIRI